MSKGALAEIFRCRRATKWLLLYAQLRTCEQDDGLSHEQDENKLKFCKRWSEALTEKGLIQGKSWRDRRDRAGDVKESHLLAFAVARRALHR
jgi:hypothetical protein